MEPARESLAYREEVTAIIGAVADLVVELRRIRELLEDEEEDDEEERSERARREAENSPIVRQLRELYARGMAEVEERRKLNPSAR